MSGEVLDRLDFENLAAPRIQVAGRRRARWLRRVAWGLGLSLLGIILVLSVWWLHFRYAHVVATSAPEGHGDSGWEPGLMPR